MLDPTVVEISRDWVCIRLVTYEDADEAKFLASIYTGGAGSLENTTFCLLGPDGETRLSGSGRGPLAVLDTIRVAGGCGGTSGSATERFADVLREAGRPFRCEASIASLPLCHDLRRALIVAACDDQPLVVAVAAEESQREAQRRALAELAWSEEFVGRFQYAVVADRAELRLVHEAPAGDGVFVVQPGLFGLRGDVVARAGEASAPALRAMLRDALEAYDRVPLDRRTHVARGRRQGNAWEPAVSRSEKRR